MLENASKDDEHFTTISSSKLVDDSASQMSIEVPLELFRNLKKQEMVNIVSYLYYNVEELFPSGLPGEENK